MRDFTKKQFIDALKRNGLKIEVLWIYREADPSHGVGVVTDKNGKLDRRASFQRAMQVFEGKTAI